MVVTTVYASVNQLKAQPNVTGTQDEKVMEGVLEAASRAIDGYCNRKEFGFVAQATASDREYVGSGETHQWIDETPEVTSVSVKLESSASSYTHLSSDDWLTFRGDPKYPDYNGSPLIALMLTLAAPINLWTSSNTRGPWIGLARTDTKRPLPTVKVSAKWGYVLSTNSAPALVRQATITQAARWVKRGQSYWSDVAANNQSGQMFYRKALDPDIQMMLKMGRMIRPTTP